MRAHVLLLALSVVLRGSTGGLDEKDVTEAAVAVAANEEGDDEDDWNLTKEILQLTKISLDLDVAFFTPWGLDESQFDYLQIFRDEPESVIVAKTMDHEHCLVEFRASVPGSKADSEIDNKPGIREICREDEGGDVLVTQTSSCCKVRLGYYEAYHASFLPEMEESIRACTSRCERSDCPVVLSGFSQGKNNVSFFHTPSHRSVQTVTRAVAHLIHLFVCLFLPCRSQTNRRRDCECGSHLPSPSEPIGNRQGSTGRHCQTLHLD